ncbi:hypothetical protein [Shewanella psychrophila]|uniref:hypothetical protein n=1 Tax=Shewanella psychrophila TaxID=225848 RepID=UPI0011EA5731|nr:hypothetical protein [Shewanella psychrophila]
MSGLFRVGLMLILLGGIFLSGTNAYASEYMKKDNHIQSIQSVCLDSSAVDALKTISWVSMNPHVGHQDTPSTHTGLEHHDPSEQEFVPLISMRLLSFSQHDLHQVRPSYLLAYEFVSPPSPSFSIGYRIDFTQTLDWSLHANEKPSKLSGWKESNLLYRFSQQKSVS